MAYQSQIKATTNYRKSRRKLYSIALRVQDDADILASIENAKADGISKREWFRKLFNGEKYGG